MSTSAAKIDAWERRSGVTLHPVPGLVLTKEVGQELALGRVTFVAREALLRRYRRHGLARRHVDVLTGKVKPLYQSLDSDFERWQTYALVRTSKTRKQDLASVERLVREAVLLLAASQMSASASFRRTAKVFGDVRRARVATRDVFTLKTGGLVQAGYRLVGQPEDLQLDASWKGKRSWHFWWPLRSILFTNNKINSRYKGRLKRAAAVVGQSVFCDSVSEAFVLNVIALETLVCKRGESIGNQLLQVLWALHHWSANVDRANLADQLKDIYDLRSGIVHDGDLSGITVEHLSVSDSLLFNTFGNICRARFRSISQLSDFAKSVKAYETLGLKPRRLPKGLQWLSSTFSKHSADLLRAQLLP